MKATSLYQIAFSTLVLALVTIGCAMDQDQMQDQNAQNSRMNDQRMQSRRDSVDRRVVDKITARWPERPRLGANAMMDKYGQPQEATNERLIWHNAGPFARITVYNLETPHDFP